MQDVLHIKFIVIFNYRGRSADDWARTPVVLSSCIMEEIDLRVEKFYRELSLLQGLPGG